MRYFPAFFLLLSDIEEPFRFPHADLQVSDSPLGAHDRVVVLNHRAVQSPGRDVDLCARDCFGGRGSVYLAAPHERKQLLVNDGLLIINMNTIIGYEHSGRSTVAF